MLERFWQDITSAARALVHERGITAVAVASLAIGIAANATVFSLVQAVEFPTLIYPHASRLIVFESRNDTRGLVGMPVSAGDVEDIAAASHALDLVAVSADQSSVLREGIPARVSGRRVTPVFFGVLGVPASLGRVLTVGDAADAIVLSDSLWRARFASDPAIVGRPVRLDGGTVTVVGVMPARFDQDADFWTLLPPSLAGFNRDDRQFSAFARLAPGASLETARAQMTEVSRRLAIDYPATNKDWVTFPIELRRLHGRESRGTFLLLQVAVGIVLLIACANTANLLLARGTRRRREIAVRAALGATRGRLVRVLLTESLLLAATGGLLGAGLSVWGVRLARAVGGFPDVIDPTVNTTVLGVTALVTALTGVVCGLLPALHSAGVSPGTVLRAEDARGGGSARGRLRAGLVVVQIACALVLSACGTLMIRTLVNRAQVDLGYDPRGAVRAELALPPDRYAEPASVRALADDLLSRLEREPGVAAAGASTWALPTAAGAQRQFSLPTEHDAVLSPAIRRGVEAVTPGYFAALGVPIEAGRLFTIDDREGTSPVAIVNGELAKHLWPNRSPIGQELRLGSPADNGPIVTIIGVVRTTRRSAMHDVPVARVYLPFAQYPNGSLTLVVRAQGNAERTLQAAVAAGDPALLVEGIRTVEADVAQFVAPVRLMAWLLAAFGGVGLLLAATGVFAMMSYAVSQREQEMAVRSALGANRADLLRLVFGDALRITTIGLVVGLGVAFAAARALATFLYGVEPGDPLTMALVVVFLTLVSFGACYAPARTAAAADPMSLLRR